MFNLGFNFLSLCLTKLGSSTGVGSVLCSLAYAIKLPLSNLLFAQRWIMGAQVEALNSRSLLGLVVVVLGFLGYLYYSGPGKGDGEEQAVEEDEYRRLPAEGPPRPAEDHDAPAPRTPPPAARSSVSERSSPTPAATLYSDEEIGAVPYLALRDEDSSPDSPLKLLRTTTEIPDDDAPWAFHDRLVGCDSSNSARTMSSKKLKQGFAELVCGAEGQGAGGLP